MVGIRDSAGRIVLSQFSSQSVIGKTFPSIPVPTREKITDFGTSQR